MANNFVEVYTYSYSNFPTPNNVYYPNTSFSFDRNRGTRVFSGILNFGVIPQERKLFLLHVPTMSLYETTVSLPDGTFSFSQRWDNEQYLIGAYDYDVTYRPLLHGPF